MFKFKFPSFLPRDDKFSRLLEGLSAEAGICAMQLKHYLEEDSKQEAAEGIIVARARAKALYQQVTSELWRTYITPFDREDIQDFAFELYKIPKIIEKVKDRLNLPGRSATTADFVRQADLIVLEAEAMQNLVRALVRKSDRDVREHGAMLHDLETQGDQVLGELLTDLFAAERDARDLIQRRDIYDMLEKVIDRYRDAAAVALRIVLKHS